MNIGIKYVVELSVPDVASAQEGLVVADQESCLLMKMVQRGALEVSFHDRKKRRTYINI